MIYNNIHRTRQIVLNTDSYLSMSKSQQFVCKKRNNIKAIENALNVIQNIGFDQWEKTSNSNYLNKLIVKEINNKI